MINNIRSTLIEQVALTDPLYWILGSTSIIIIFFYGWYRCKYIKKNEDILEFSLWKNSNKGGIDGWSLSHFLLYLAYGFLYPNTFVLTTLLGILWEFFECYLGITKPKFMSEFGFCMPAKSGNKQKVWWYGKPVDIIVNSLGFITGNRLNKIYTEN